MIKGKVGCTPTFTSASSSENQIDNFAKTLQAPNGFIIDCEMYNWCLFSGVISGANSAYDAVYTISGAQTSGSLGQTIDFVFNTHLIKAKISRTGKVLPPPSGVEIKPGIPTTGIVGHEVQDTTDFGTIPIDTGYDNFHDFTSGVEADQGTATVLPGGTKEVHSMYFFSRLQGGPAPSGYQDLRSTTVASSADLPCGNAIKNFIINPQNQSDSYSLDETIAPWILVPCGAFNFLQIEIKSVSSTEEAAIAYCLNG